MADRVIVEQKRTIIRTAEGVKLIRTDTKGARVIREGIGGRAGPPGIQWLGVWSSATTYVFADTVSYQGSSWRALRTNTNVTPVEGLDWTILAAEGDQGIPGIRWLGAWSGLTNYILDDAVTYNGSSWRAKQANINIPPFEGDEWAIIAAKGESGALGGDLYYEHVQASSAATWIVTHNLGKYPAIRVVNTANITVWCGIEDLSVNAVRLTFNPPMAGKAFCS